jgi:hypothetical protein
VPRWIIGDTLTGRRIQTVPVVSGQWSDVLNRAGDISCTVTLNDPVVQKLGLQNSAAAGKAFLACVEGDTVLQAGPIWRHSYNNGNSLTLYASGLWSYFDRRVLLPPGTTDPADESANTEVTSSFQGIARAYVAQAMSWPGGDVPVVLPDEIAGSNERTELGASLNRVGALLTDLTRVEGGPDIQFRPRLTADKMGVEWVMRIGTPEQPQLFSPQDVVFTWGVAGSSLSNLRVEVSGAALASVGYAAGGRQSEEAIVSMAVDSTLTDHGYPLMEAVDSSRSTVTRRETMDAWAAALTTRGRRPIMSVSFDHDLSQRPFLSAFNVGDFASLRVHDDNYLPDGQIRMRVTARSGDAVGDKVHLEMQPVFV